MQFALKTNEKEVHRRRALKNSKPSLYVYRKSVEKAGLVGSNFRYNLHCAYITTSLYVTSNAYD